jgi:hypothetical protein
VKRNSLVQVFLLIALSLALAAPAGADTIAEGRLTLNVDRGLRSSLHRGGAKLRGIRPAVGQIVINLPLERGGGLEASGKGRLPLDGGIQFGAKGRRATFRDLVLDTAFGTLSASLAGRRLALATASGLSSKRRGFGTELGLRRLTLTRSAAAAIDARLRIPGLLSGGEALGSATAVARFELLRLIDGQAYLLFAQGLGDKLESLKVETESLGGGWLYTSKPPAPVLADTAGEVALDLTSGSFRSADGFLLKQEGTSQRVSFQGIEFDLGAKLIRASVTRPSGAASTIPLATFDLPVVHKNAYTGLITTPSSPAILSTAMAAVLDEAFAAPSGHPSLFEAGEQFGSVALLLRTHGPPRE